MQASDLARKHFDAAMQEAKAGHLDPDAVARGRRLADAFGGRLTLVQGEFSRMDEFAEATDGIVLDLGVSSFQFDEPARGFSFREDGPLDMRMSRSGVSAADAAGVVFQRHRESGDALT